MIPEGSLAVHWLLELCVLFVLVDLCLGLIFFEKFLFSQITIKEFGNVISGGPLLMYFLGMIM